MAIGDKMRIRTMLTSFGLGVLIVAGTPAVAEERIGDPGVSDVLKQLEARAKATAARRGKVLHKNIQERADRGERVDVMVLLKGYRAYKGTVRSDRPAVMKKVQAEIHAKQKAVMDRIGVVGFKQKHRFQNILGFAGTVTKAGLNALVAHPDVASIEEDKKVEPHLAQGISLMNGSRFRSVYDGTGVSVAIVDTGIEYTHPMLGGGGFPNAKVIGGYDFGDNDADPMDCSGHGTAVAGIVAGTLASGPGDYIGGVAHNAKLYALKIIAGCGGGSSFSTIVAAWDWAVTHQYDDPANPILAINTSFGGEKYTAACDASQPALAAAADNAVENGITVFSSSGNSAYTDGIAAPACVSNSLSVGAVYDADIYAKYWDPCTDLTTAPDQVACYSNSADFLDILAPSHNAYTLTAGWQADYTSDFGGTSAAAPYAAGAGALLQSYAKKETGTYYSPEELKARLVNTGDLITDAKNNITKPRVNISAAVDLPVQTEQTPWRMNENGIVFTDIPWDYTMGYHFTPIKNGHIRWLGGFFNGTRTVSLWNTTTGELLAQASVTAANGWGYTKIKVVPVTAGTSYTVAVYLAGSGGSARNEIDSFPQTYEDITITGTAYAVGNDRPIISNPFGMFGQVDIGYVPAPIQTPWQTIEDGTLVTDIALDYTMGYNFTPTKDGQITKLSGYFNGTKKVSLWNKTTGALLTQQSIPSSNAWSSVDIDPVTVRANTTYTVAAYMANSGASYRKNITTLPRTDGDITIEGSTFTAGDRRPENNFVYFMNGQVDVGFVAFAGQTPWKHNENGTLVTDNAWDYTMGYHFTPRRNGTISWLGGYFDGTKNVYLWNKDTGKLLAEATVSAANGWGYVNIIVPVRVWAGTTYTVAAYLAGSGASYRTGIDTLPQIYDDIIIKGSTWITGNTRPTLSHRRAMYGQVDVGFEPGAQE